MDSSPFDSSQQTTEGELYAGNAQSSSCLTGEPVAYLLCSVSTVPDLYLIVRSQENQQFTGVLASKSVHSIAFVREKLDLSTLSRGEPSPLPPKQLSQGIHKFQFYCSLYRSGRQGETAHAAGSATDRLPVSKTAGSESRRPRRSFSSAAAGSRPSHVDRASGATTLRSSLADSNPRDGNCPCALPNRVDYSTGHRRSRGSYRRTDLHNGHGRALPHASPGDPRADGDAPLRCKTASESLRVYR